MQKLDVGTRLAHYRITAAIGEGGMGEVFRANDTKLGRDVAIKLLLPDGADDPERLARFDREARLLASLNHPNVASIYALEDGLGEAGPHSRALVMELVEGPTLADRIAGGRLEAGEALGIARQVAEALAAAHAKGIVHRDLKPANVKVRPDGTVKVLDFGLAKALGPDPSSAGNEAEAPTLDGGDMTRPGLLLGTPAYMSPEQARGLAVDERTDLWALGVLLFEMLAGSRPFRGGTLADTLASVLAREPDWPALPAGTPEPVRVLLRRCLEKEVVRRIARATDAREALEELGRPGTGGPGPAPESAPSVAGKSATPSNLPVFLSSFVGREAEVRDVAAELGRRRLVTLTGAGGCGKSRLALQVASETLGRCRDGTFRVDLSSVPRPDEVAQAVARALGLREEHGRPLLDTLAEQLASREMLLVLDNCVHVRDGAAGLAGSLLRAVPGLTVLATSREPLGVEGEVTWRVSPLDAAAGCRLFVERAGQVLPRYAPEAAEREVIGRIVDRLDGLPLAIELAAARMRMMPPARILDALDDRFRLLTGGRPAGVPHQQTLEASIAWSYDLLDPAEQTLAQRLSAMRTFALEAAEEVGGGGDVDPFDVLDLLARLVDKSLVQAEPSGGDGRYRFLESVRQFLHARLLASGEADAVRKRHLAHYLGLAERLAPRLALGDGPACLARLEAEHHNLDGALEWALATKGSEALLRLVTALSLFYELRGHLAHGGRWFDRALGAASDAPPALRARSLWGAAHVAFYGGDYEKAAARAAEARDLAEAAGDRWAFARALNTLGVMQALEDPEEARVSLARSIELGRSIDDAWAVADGWKMTTVAWYVQHDDAGARGAMEELRRLGESLGSRFFLAWHHALEGFFARARGEYAVARAAFESSLEDCRFVGDPSTGGFAEVWSAALEADEGRPERAAQRLEKLLETAAATGSELAVPEAVAALVAVTLGQGDSSRALGRASKHLEATRGAGVPLWTAQVLVERAAAQRETGDLPGAASALDEATRLVARLANVPFEARIDFEKGLLARAEGDDARAGELLEHARERQARLGLRPALVRTLEAQAALAADTDRPERASGLLADADALRAAVGLARRPADGPSRPRP